VRNPFSSYHSYAWQSASGGARDAEGFDNPIEDARVRRAVATELDAKGFAPVGAGNPDFLVAYKAIGEGSRSHQLHLGIGIGLGPIGLGIGAPVGNAQTEAVAGIRLEIIDYRTLALVWKATADGALQGMDDPKEADTQVREAVHGMLKRFPPKP
jgi:hypothetical protein